MARYIAFFVLLVWAALSSTLAEGRTYRWVDANGVVHYSDQPPPESTRAPDTSTPAGPPAAKGKASGAPPTTGRGRPVNCGQDFDCFVRHARSCTPARVARTDDIDFLGLVTGKSTTQYELEGLRAGACRFTQRALDVRVKLGEDSRAQLRAEGKTDAEIAEVERTWLERLRAEGQDRQTCDFPPKRLLEIVTALRQGALLISSTEDTQYCRIEN